MLFQRLRFYAFLCFNFTLCVSLTPDGLSLLSLKSAVDGGASSSAFSDWNEDDATPCHWTGISCMNVTKSEDPRVVGISVSAKNLRGYIPSELGNLVYLRRLNLHGNNFYGSIPEQLFNASSLHSIFLYGNNLSGSLPPSLCTLPRVQNIDLSNNSLTGPLPKFLQNCKQLQRLILAGNKFSGEISEGIFPALANLEQLDISSNGFNTSIPNDIGELKSLSGTLNLSFNQFTGRIPKTLGDLPLTVSFDLRNNNLSGEIPQTGSLANQGPTAFLNNPLLCGFPLQRSCKNDLDNNTDDGAQSSLGGNEGQRGLKPGLIILISVANALGVAFIGLVIVYFYWRRKDSHGHGCSCTGKGKLGGNGNEKISLCSLPCFNGFPSNDSEVESEKDGGGGGGGEGDLVAIDKGFSIELDELLRASAYVLGKSGLGIVYKVVLGNGVPVAVRRLGEGGEQMYKEFVAEVQAIGRVKHPNVVKLRAYYWALDEKLLISDFISNGSLAFALRGGAFPYLKPVQLEKVNNYRAPEARFPNNRPTQKWDVYSFGLVLLELLTGKSTELSPPTSSTSTEILDLVRWVRKGFDEEIPMSDMVDPMLLQEIHAKKEVLSVFHIALSCTEGDPEARPRMKTVSDNLEKRTLRAEKHQTMATAQRTLSTKEADIQMMLAAEVHLGTKNCDFQMERYVFKRRNDGIYIINLGKTWEKLQMAARVIVAIENPQDIIVQSARPYGQRAVLKFAQYTGTHAIAGRHTPGTFTNQMQTSFSEPRLLILTDPRTDHQPIKEAALSSIPTIAFCDTDSPMRYVDIGIPANNKGKHSIGCLFWLLGRMVLQMRGVIPPGHKWDIMVDLFFYREPEETKEQEEEEVPALPDYADYSAAAIGGDWSSGQIPDAQWAPDLASAIPPVASGWTADSGVGASDGWDAAAAPPIATPADVDPVVAASGWE
ncbi:hypothetical protein ACJIZ3_010414 [Penstemon smallii]|uniref:Small ribosomal subunit protein uS2 n=1 Tax=Penstemon smallii TaxID=265156 RepID=A0ABD3TH56_9LAMI